MFRRRVWLQSVESWSHGSRKGAALECDDLRGICMRGCVVLVIVYVPAPG